MRWSIAAAAFATAVSAQQCTRNSYDGKFQLNPVNISSTIGPRSIEARQANCAAPDALTIELKNGVLTDSEGRIGSIVANYQFQFDGPPPQAGALVTDGYSICGNNSLATKGRAVWYQCSDLTRTSIYGPDLTPVGNACYQVYYEVLPCGASSGRPSITLSRDGQPAVTSCVPVTTMKDGQPVVSSCPPPPPTSSCVPITTLKDGQPVVSSCPPPPPPPPTSTCVPITTLKDGQPVVSSCPPPAPTSTCVPVTTLKDGQPVVVPCPTSIRPTGGIITPTPTNVLNFNAADSIKSSGSFVAAMAAVMAVFM